MFFLSHSRTHSFPYVTLPFFPYLTGIILLQLTRTPHERQGSRAHVSSSSNGSRMCAFRSVLLPPQHTQKASLQRQRRVQSTKAQIAWASRSLKLGRNRRTTPTRTRHGWRGLRRARATLGRILSWATSRVLFSLTRTHSFTHATLHFSYYRVSLSFCFSLTRPILPVCHTPFFRYVTESLFLFFFV